MLQLAVGITMQHLSQSQPIYHDPIGFMPIIGRSNPYITKFLPGTSFTSSRSRRKSFWQNALSWSMHIRWDSNLLIIFEYEPLHQQCSNLIRWSRHRCYSLCFDLLHQTWKDNIENEVVYMFWMHAHQFIFKGSRSNLQISLNITKLCKDDKYTIMMMFIESYSCRL